MLNGIQFMTGVKRDIKEITDICNGFAFYVGADGADYRADLQHVLYIKENGLMTWRRLDHTTWTPNGFVVK